jgi:transposase
MKRVRFSEEQIIGVLKEAEGRAKVADLWRRHGISDATFYTWRSKYGGLKISEMRRDVPTREREPAESDRRGLGARYSGAQGRTGKRRLRPAVKRLMVAEVMSAYPAVAASHLWAERDHATRVKAYSVGRSQPRVAATTA